MYHYKQSYGRPEALLFARDYYTHGGTQFNFGRIMKDIYDILYVRLD